ncbi:MAG: hypothetical protein ACKVT0_13460 [Planctomycetaceae bacterium]
MPNQGASPRIITERQGEDTQVIGWNLARETLLSPVERPHFSQERMQPLAW